MNPLIRWSLIPAIALTASTWSQAQEPEAREDAPLSDIFRSSPEDVREYQEHLIILASPWMGGRLPGTRGAELAREYVETQFKTRGLKPVMNVTGDGGSGYRQPFPLGSSSDLVEIGLSSGDYEFDLDRDFIMTEMGADAGITAPLSFVGYGIESGPDDFSSFSEEDDLSGRIAVLFRFEPMNEEGKSLWSESGWSSRSTFDRKFRAVTKRNPAGIILVNPPGADDRRADALFNSAQRMVDDVPVFMMTPEAAEQLLNGESTKPRSIEDWRTLADTGEGGTIDIEDVMVTMMGRREVNKLYGENVLGMIEGRGDIADEYVVIGAHIDHLGMGDFGSNEGPSGKGKFHPGADDNASGVAALIMLAESLQTAYDEAPEDMPLRDIIIIAFDGEESGLHGSRFYVNNPAQPLDDLNLMINFDMIGRIENDRRLSISGTGTGKGMSEWAKPLFAASSLEIVESEASTGGSDHSEFLGKGIPILFAITPFPLHNDYHTSRDTIDLINFEGGTETVKLFHELAYSAASSPEKMEFSSPRRNGGDSNAVRARPRNMPKVQLGIRSTTDEGEPGLRIVFVTDDSSAALAGIEVGDRMVRWDDSELRDRSVLIDQLRKHEPGDIVNVMVIRDGKEQSIEVKLLPRGE
jgi:Zn-dependent M28 family amino/carboxypeptidase